MKKLLLLIAIVTSFVACKKENLEPKEVIVEKIVKQTDTVKTNTKDTIKVVVHDTTIIYQTNEPLQGKFWMVYKVEKYNGGKLISTETPNWIFKFSFTDVIENKQSLGVFTYKVKTNTTYLDIFDNGAIASTFVPIAINGGKEYKLTQIVTSGESVVWYLKQ